MLVPISWLKEYVDIKLPIKELCSRLTEVGLGVEEVIKDKDDYILNIEVTPNRPDCMSVYGIAREISAITNSVLKKEGSLKYFKKLVKSSPKIKIKPNYEIVPRVTSVIIKNVKVKPSPEWLQKRIKQVGLRPINNLVDITNYVLWTYGSLLHSFDYEQIHGKEMNVELSVGGEHFRSLDGIEYKLPKNSIIIKDADRIIDLLPFKGGENTATFEYTKNILLHSVVVDPLITRKTSQALGLRSDSSVIAERGLDPNGTLIALNKTIQLILDLAGGEIASEIIDHKALDFKPWTINLNLEKVNRVLGINLSKDEIISLLKRIGLTTCRDTLQRVSTNLKNKKQIPSIVETCHGTSLQIQIPTYRNDLHIEEDLIEEIARIYGYNKFPQTMPTGVVPTEKVAYHKDYRPDFQMKNLLKSSGFSEVYTYSLISAQNLSTIGSDPKVALKIKNPVNSDYEYLRPALLPNLLSAIKQNQPHYEKINLFELGKIYRGENLKKVTEEYELALVTNEKEGFSKLKGVIEILNRELNISLEMIPQEPKENLLSPTCYGKIYLKDKPLGEIGQISQNVQNNYSIKNPVFSLLLNYSQILPALNQKKTFNPLPKYPAIIEDLTLVIPGNTTYAEIIKTIKSVSLLISNIQYLNIYQNSLSLRIYYQSTEKTLTEDEVHHLRSHILTALEKINIQLKTI